MKAAGGRGTTTPDDRGAARAPAAATRGITRAGIVRLAILLLLAAVAGDARATWLRPDPSYQEAELAIQGGETQAKKIARLITRIVESEPEATLDYVVVVDPERLEPRARIQGPTLVAVGVRVGNTPLNDSALVAPPR